MTNIKLSEHDTLRALLESRPQGESCIRVGLDFAQRIINEHARACETIEENAELQMRREDYTACKQKGFQSPGELLAAYLRLEREYVATLTALANAKYRAASCPVCSVDEEGPEQQSVPPRWVSVAERYPEVGEDVVYYFGVCGTFVGTYLGEHCFAGEAGFLTDDVTHWMPYSKPKQRVKKAPQGSPQT